MPPTFRPAAQSDLDTLRDFLLAFHREDGHPIEPGCLERALRAVADGEPLLHVWVIELDTSAVGYVALALGYSIEVGGLDAFLDELYVLPAARGRGIGASAVAFVERESARLGVRRLCLEVETHNESARALYRTLGYADHSRHLMSKSL